ncbi:MAG: TetR/AcrR family transcriptional regulator [Proteobacteria bacterium]|nr:TetR/AcrR family transcriptional regulator [Pseudomonadota bacterium]
MKRSEKSLELRNIIIDVTRDLLLAQGYQKTTIRQIIKKAGINTGSLYHFFRDKDDIFRHFVTQTYNEFIEYADRLTENETDNTLRYALTRALEMKAVERYDRIAELYHTAYSSWTVTQTMLPINIQRKRIFFEAFNPDFTEADYYNRTLALRGMRLSFFSQRLYEGPGQFETQCPFLLEAAFNLFHVPKPHTDTVIARTMELVKQDSMAVYGFTL